MTVLVGASSRYMNEGVVPELRYCPSIFMGGKGNPQKASVRITAAPTEVGTEYFPSMDLERDLCGSLLGLDVCGCTSGFIAMIANFAF
jgi:hypothetical protein